MHGIAESVPLTIERPTLRRFPDPDSIAQVCTEAVSGTDPLSMFPIEHRTRDPRPRRLVHGYQSSQDRQTETNEGGKTISEKETKAREALAENPLLYDQELEDVYEFLDKLRTSGVTNMFGAGTYVEEMFEVDKRTAKALLLAWMETFNDRHPPSLNDALQASIDEDDYPGLRKEGFFDES